MDQPSSGRDEGPRAGLGAALVRLAAGQLCLHASMTGMRMATPLLLLSQQHARSAVGLVVAMFALAQLLLLLPAGRFADRHGLRRPIVLCVIGSSSGIWLAALWPHVAALCVAASLCGTAAGVANLAIQRHVGRMVHTPAELRQAFSWLSIAPAAANFVGPLLAGIAIDLAGFPAAFALLGTLPVMAWLLLRHTPQSQEQLPPVAERAPAWELLRVPVFRRLLLMNWFMTASWDLHAFLVPVMGHDRGLPASAIGAVLGAFAMGAATVRVLMPLFAAHVREWALITGACATTAVLLLIYPLATIAPAMGACSFALGLAFGCVQPMVTTLLHHVTPRHRHGEAIALRLMMINASMVAIPPLLGVVSTAVGVSAMFWAMGSLVGLCAPLGARLRGVVVEEGGR